MNTKLNSTNPEQAVHTAETIQAWLILKLSTALNVNADKIGVQLPLTSFGLDSILTFNLTGDLADWLGYEIPATLLWDYPTIDKLASHLADQLAQMGAARVLHDQIVSASAEVDDISDQTNAPLQSIPNAKR